MTGEVSIIKNTNYLLIIIGVVILIGGGFFLLTSKQPNQTKQPQSSGTSITTPMTKEEVQKMIAESEAVAELAAVEDYTGKGTAMRIYANSIFILTISADIADPAEGKFYEGWLVKKDPELTFFSTGRLTLQNNRYSVNFRENTDYTDYNEVVVTEETESLGLDDNPETHVLEGAFN